MTNKYLFVVLGIALAIGAYSQDWHYGGAFPSADGWPQANGQGLAVDGEGKIWYTSYYPSETILVDTDNDGLGDTDQECRAIYIFNPDGSQASFSPIKTLTVDSTTDTLWGANRGLRRDNNGNIAAASGGIYYRIDHLTGEGLDKLIPYPTATPPGQSWGGEFLSAPAFDNDGNMVCNAVYTDLGPLKAFDSDWNHIGDLVPAETFQGWTRTIEISPDGSTVYYFNFFTGFGIVRFNSSSGDIYGEFTTDVDTLFPGLSVEVATWDPQGRLWVGNSEGAAFTNAAFYAFDPISETMVDSIITPRYLADAGIRPRGIDFDATGETAYITYFNSADLDAIHVYHKNQSSTVAHWTFDEGSGTQVFDQSGNGHHGTIQNGASWSTGINGGAIEFDGIDDHVNTNSEFLWGLQSGTIEVILKPDIIDNDNWFLAYGMDTHKGVAMCIDQSNSACFQLNEGSGGVSRGPAGQVHENNWYHLALTWDGSTAKSYINGVLDLETSNSGMPLELELDLLIGVDSYFRDQHSFDGVIDEIRISSGVLQAEEFLAFEQSDQSVFFNGPVVGGRIRITNSNPINENAIPEAYQINGSNITVEAWVYPLDFPASEHGNHIAGYAIYPEADPWRIYGLSINQESGEPKPAFEISDGSPGSLVTVVSTDAISAQDWTHIAGSYDGQMLNIYINGELKGSVATTIAIGGEGAGFYIGRFISDRFFGLIDEVRLWDVTRSQSEIADNMLRRFEGNEAGLAGYWPLDGTAAEMDIAVDKTANHNDLIIQSPISFTTITPGSGVGVADISDYPTSIDFGAVEQANIITQNFSLTNSSTSPLIGVGRIDDDNFSIDLVSGFVIPPESTEEISISMSSLLSGVQDGLLIIESNAANQVSIPFTIESIALQNIDANSINMWVQRDGRFARDPFPPRYAGFEWPSGGGVTSIYASGVWVGAQVNGDYRSAIAEYDAEFQAGPIKSDGSLTDPGNQKYRVYKIQAGDNANSNVDYAEWPLDLGALVKSDGTPLLLGDQTLFHVYNDLNPDAHLDGAGPLGLEVHQTTFALDAPGVLSNTVFVGFKIINKSSDIWDDTYLTLWCDPDVGDAYDDFVGIDTIRNMAYAYNGDNIDEANAFNSGYGNQAPAIGYKILKGSFYTKPIQAFSFYTNGVDYPFHDPSEPEEYYNSMQGRLLDGSYRIDPHTGQTSVFPFSGNPESGSGWVDSEPGDRRFLMSTGPFDLDPGQSRDLLAAIIVGQGSDYLNSVAVLRTTADELQILYESGAVLGGILHGVVSLEIPDGSTGTIDEIASMGIQVEASSGEGGATLEVAAYLDSPPATADIGISNLSSVGKYYDIQNIGEIDWPVRIYLYYTDQDLLDARITEAGLSGAFYWSGRENRWISYSESGEDDQGRGISSVIKVTSDIELNGVQYAGYVGVLAYHLNPMILGGEQETTAYEKSKLESLPTEFSFRQNYPNPFNPTTTIRYGLPEASDVSLILYDITGKRVKTLVLLSQSAGWFDIEWNGLDDNGHPASAGTYIAKIQAGSFTDVIKMVYLK